MPPISGDIGTAQYFTESLEMIHSRLIVFFFKTLILTYPALVIIVRGQSPIKKNVYFLFRKKTGSIFHATKKNTSDVR